MRDAGRWITIVCKHCLKWTLVKDLLSVDYFHGVAMHIFISMPISISPSSLVRS